MGRLSAGAFHQRLPVVLSQEEVALFFDYVPSLRYRAALMTAYGAGLRVSEVVALKVADIDSKRMLLRVEQGKGKKDRYTLLPQRLLQVLRIWWRSARPPVWIFPGWREGRHMNCGALQLACREAASRAGLTKRVTVHTLPARFRAGRHFSTIRRILSPTRIPCCCSSCG